MMKIALLGDFGTGKSSLYQRMTKGTYTEEENEGEDYDFEKIEVTVGNKIVNVQLWDTAGMEEHSAIEGSYFRGLLGFFLVYDVSNLKSYQRIDYWRKQVETFASDGVQLVLIGHKCDLPEKLRVVDAFEGKSCSSKLNCPYLEVSAKQNMCVQEALQTLVGNVLQANPQGIETRAVQSLAKVDLSAPMPNMSEKRGAKGDKKAGKADGGCC